MKNRWINSYLSQDEISRVGQTVKEAEANSTGEIVPMIVRSSSTVGHLPLIITLLLTSITLAIDVPLEHSLKEFHVLSWLWPIVILFYYGFSLVLSRALCVQRWLSLKGDLSHQVHARAQLEFFLNQVHKTEKATAILIFISVMERRAVVLADRAIAEKVPSTAWQEAVDYILNGIKQGKLAEGLTKAIESGGSLLKTHFPAHGAGVNELSNQLVIKE